MHFQTYDWLSTWHRHIGAREGVAPAIVIGRQDGENLFLLKSDTLTHWDEGQKLLTPAFPWELVQIGNCGPPIELDEGWLLLTHGVGAMRKYAIGAVLLDKDNLLEKQNFNSFFFAYYKISNYFINRSLIQIFDGEIFNLMQQNGDYTHFYFCYRWFLLDFKRGKLYSFKGLTITYLMF